MSEVSGQLLGNLLMFEILFLAANEYFYLIMVHIKLNVLMREFNAQNFPRSFQTCTQAFFQARAAG